MISFLSQNRCPTTQTHNTHTCWNSEDNNRKEKETSNSYKITKQYFLNSVKQEHRFSLVIAENKHIGPEANKMLILGEQQSKGFRP